MYPNVCGVHRQSFLVPLVALSVPAVEEILFQDEKRLDGTLTEWYTSEYLKFTFFVHVQESNEKNAYASLGIGSWLYI